jgi:hypothetical protein
MCHDRTGAEYAGQKAGDESVHECPLDATDSLIIVLNKIENYHKIECGCRSVFIFSLFRLLFYQKHMQLAVVSALMVKPFLHVPEVWICLQAAHHECAHSSPPSSKSISSPRVPSIGAEDCDMQQVCSCETRRYEWQEVCKHL